MRKWTTASIPAALVAVLAMTLPSGTAAYGAPLDADQTFAAEQAALARPDFRAPWPCGQTRDYFHHSSEVSNAIDFNIAGSGDLGTPAVASAAGTVTSAGVNGGYGNQVVVDHGGGWSSRVAHLNAFSVRAGQVVAAGQELGKVGSTGNSSGPHLHYEQISGGARVPIIIDSVAMIYDGATRQHRSGNCGGGGGARTVVALTPTRSAVMRYNGSPLSWTQIGGPAKELIGGGGLAAITPNNDGINRYLGPGRWERAGGPGVKFAFGGSTLYALGPGSQAVLAYNGSPNSWTKIGGAAATIYAGGAGLVATVPGSGNVMRYAGSPGNWQHIGGASGTVGVTGTQFFAETPTQSAIMRYNGAPHSWTQVGNAGRIQHAGGYGLLATTPTTGEAMLYRPSTGWVRIGGPGRQFVVTDDTVYALTTDGSAVMRYNGSPNSWTKVGGAAAQIVPSP